MVTITAEVRNIKDNLNALRKGGMVPGVYYGLGMESVPITIDRASFEKAWRQAGESTPITLDIDKKHIDAFIHEVQFDPVKNYALHVDFLVVDMSKPVTVMVPLVFTGIAPAVKSGLGSLVEVLHEIEIEALPKSLPHEMTVDVSTLATLEDKIHISDIAVPAGVKILTQPEEIVAVITAYVEEKEEVAPIDLTQIEVEKKGKKEEEPIEAEAVQP